MQETCRVSASDEIANDALNAVRIAPTLELEGNLQYTN
jgi:hypothetical protein